MSSVDLERRLSDLRPRLHRYCARMTGSVVDGEDVLQETLVKALQSQDRAGDIANLDAWLLRIAHNASLDFIRSRSRASLAPLAESVAEPSIPGPDPVAVGFRTFLQLPELQRCAVILKDVLGHSIDEIAVVASVTPAAAKSALQRGRAALRRLAALPPDTLVPLMSQSDRLKLSTYVSHFRSGDFDALRALLADDVKLELVNRLELEGRAGVGTYFSRYAEETRWRYSMGAVEGRPAVLVFDERGPAAVPAHFVLLGWRGNELVLIRDFLYASYVMEGADWTRLA